MSTSRRDAALAELRARTAGFAGLPLASASDVISMQQGGRDVILIDVRSPPERAVSTLPGALDQHSFAALAREEPERVAAAVLVPFCTIGYRSGLYCEWIRGGGLGTAASSELDVRNGEGVVLWSHDVGTFVQDGAPVRSLHVYGSAWDLAADGFDTVTFGPAGHLSAALRVAWQWFGSWQ